MLILSRKIGEQIQIGDQICVTVVRIGPGGVRLGIDAPQGCSIARSELTAPPAEGPRPADERSPIAPATR